MKDTLFGFDSSKKENFRQRPEFLSTKKHLMNDIDALLEMRPSHNRIHVFMEVWLKFKEAVPIDRASVLTKLLRNTKIVDTILQFTDDQNAKDYKPCPLYRAILPNGDNLRNMGKWELVYDRLDSNRVQQYCSPEVIEVFDKLPNFGAECTNYKPSDFEVPEIEANSLVTKAWRNEDWLMFGTVSKESDKPHGIVRHMWKGQLFEYQYKESAYHGLCRFILKNGVKIGEHKEGRPHGVWTTYTYDGKVKDTVEFEDGIKVYN